MGVVVVIFEKKRDSDGDTEVHLALKSSSDSTPPSPSSAPLGSDSLETDTYSEDRRTRHADLKTYFRYLTFLHFRASVFVPVVSGRGNEYFLNETKSVSFPLRSLYDSKPPRVHKLQLHGY